MKTIVSLFEKLREKNGMMVILLVGLVGVALFLLGGEGDTEEAPTADTENMQEYIENLELRVGHMISKIEGVSSVEVMLQPDGGEENVYARNGSEGSAQYVIIDGRNGDEALLVKRVEPKIRGAAVICRGGDDPSVQVKIVNLLCALFNLQSNRVYVSG